MRFLILLTVLFSASAYGVQPSSVWPNMQEFEIDVDIDLHGKGFLVEIPILDVNGKTRYWLVCRSRYHYQVLVPFDCKMLSGGMEPSQDYIKYIAVDIFEIHQSTTRSWSRGRVTGTELVGACGEYPEFGRVRHFRQRGFEVTLEFSDIVFDTADEAFPEFVTMHISLYRDPTAQTAFAEMPGYLDPQGDCEVIRKGSEPYICYDWFSFSEKECISGSEYEPNFAEFNPYALLLTPEQIDLGRQRSKAWTYQKESGYPMNIVEERLALVRAASREKDGDVLRPIIPEPPFMLLCGKAGTPEWKGLRVDDMADWNRLWLAILSQNSFNGIEDLSMDEVQLSSKYGIWIRGETFRFQDGLTVATDLSCSMLERTLD